MSLRLEALRASVPVRAIRGDASVQVVGVRHDSRAIEPGELFVARSGERADGARFVAEALSRGAVAVLADHPIDCPVPLVLVDDARSALPFVAEAVYGHPSREVRVIGVTGTNGKTTTSWILDEALAAMGAHPALIGTIELRGPGGFREPSSFTTPEADHIARFLRAMRGRGASHLVMEVSSHALGQHRVDAITFDTAIFTNLTQDHLDYHGSMERYFEAKARLFLELEPRLSIVRVDDAWGVRLAQEVARRVGSGGPRTLLRVSRDPRSSADLRPRRWESSREGITADVDTPWGLLPLRSRLVGAHNLDNLLFVAAALGAAGVSLAEIASTLAAVRGAPGRLERVEAADDVAVVVDYAHTPDALVNALAALRPLTPGRLILVFGCGGDRDHGKRPLMGQAAIDGADLVLVTSDNPRTEAPDDIIRDILPPIRSTFPTALSADALVTARRGYRVEADRRAAIRLGVRSAIAGDTVLIAGKGHEDYQIVGDRKLHLDDREEARDALAERSVEVRP